MRAQAARKMLIAVNKGDITNLVKILKMKDDELLEIRAGIVVRFQRAINRLVLLSRFAKKIGLSGNLESLDLSTFCKTNKKRE